MTKDEKDILCDALIKIIDVSTTQKDGEYNKRLSEILKPMEEKLGIAEEMDKRLIKLLSPFKFMAEVLNKLLKEMEEENGSDD